MGILGVPWGSRGSLGSLGFPGVPWALVVLWGSLEIQGLGLPGVHCGSLGFPGIPRPGVAWGSLWFSGVPCCSLSGFPQGSLGFLGVHWGSLGFHPTAPPARSLNSRGRCCLFLSAHFAGPSFLGWSGSLLVCLLDCLHDWLIGSLADWLFDGSHARIFHSAISNTCVPGSYD